MALVKATRVRGGWGALLRYGDAEKELFGGEQDTTNNRMELMAVIKGLRSAKSCLGSYGHDRF